MVSLVRREIAEQGANFINSANSLFSRSSVKAKRSIPKTATRYRLGVTVYYFQDDIEGATQSKSKTTYRRRKNLRRQRRPTDSREPTGAIDRSVAKGQL